MYGETYVQEDPCWDTHKQVGMKKKGDKMVPNCVPKNEDAEDRVKARIKARQTANDKRDRIAERARTRDTVRDIRGEAKTQKQVVSLIQVRKLVRLQSL